MGNNLKNLLVWGVFLLAIAFGIQTMTQEKSDTKKIEYSQFIQQVKEGKVDNVNINGTPLGYVIKGARNDAEKSTFVTDAPMDDHLVQTLLDNHVRVKVTPEEKPSILAGLFTSLLPMILLLAVFMWFMRAQAGGGKGSPFSFGKSRAKLLDKDANKVTFADVAGCDEAKEEVQEIVDYLKAPNRYQTLGGRVPRGVLLSGSPGTGKTLLAKAVAGEAGVPFFTISGSDFLEMFVGVGASRVRDMFEQAKKNAPCIIFIDEIDAVGRKRGGAGFSGGHDEREQTLNQMLVEMDGFEGSEGVIIIAATNRADVLDDALTRPGRFDRQVTVDLPNVKGREQILQVHLKKVPLADDVNAMQIARGTPGYSGAQLANLVNEAALFAARKNRRVVTMEDFEQARDKINMGPERRSNTMTEKEIINTAYHEAGHVIVGYLMPEHDPLNKVTIVPRGQALGFAQFLPEGDRVSETFTKLESQLSTLFAGRIAEGLIFGEDKITTGASSDIHRATQIARAMVTQWGFSKELGPIFYQNEDGMGAIKGVSEESQKLIDVEMRKIIDRNYNRAKQTLEDNMDILHAMKDALLKYETLDRNQIDDLMARRPVGEPSGWNDKPKDEQPKSDDKIKTDLESETKVEPNVSDNQADA